jgi:hypothetical protein
MSCLTSTVSTAPKRRRSIKRKIPKNLEHMLPPKPKRPLTPYLAFMRESMCILLECSCTMSYMWISKPLFSCNTLCRSF